MSRTTDIDMSDRMRYSPMALTIKQGETIRFRINNSGKLRHEMVLGTRNELLRHAELMRQHPGMQHDDPYLAHVASGKVGTLIWQFTEPGELYCGCRVPGHFEAGMVGEIVVTKGGGK